MPHRVRLALLCLALALAAYGAWWWPNRAQADDVAAPATRFQSVSFAPFRWGQSPLTGQFPSAAEVDEDIRTIAPRVEAIRTYASIEGDYEVAEIAARHGLAVFQGAWLGQDRAQNRRELDRLIAIANRHPGTVRRVIVGNEVLLRRDLSPAELIAALDRVKAAVRQPVTYADVWEFWEQFPEVARHVDVVTVHILPYWEDDPTGIDGAMAHVREVYRRMKALFPGKPVVIGETGWPSRGRAREDAAPGRVEQAVFLRRFIALARAEGFDYNLIEAFDQIWKYRNEGTVGANWGLWTHDRRPKVALAGPVSEWPGWRWYAAAGIGLALLLLGGALRAFPGLPWPAQARLAVLAFALGGALPYAAEGAVAPVYDAYLAVCATANLAGQALLALLVMHRAGAILSGAPAPLPPAGTDTHAAVACLLAPWRAGWRAHLHTLACSWRATGLDHLQFLFAFAAATLTLMLVFDPRYRDFPLPTFAVPAVAVGAQAALSGWPRLAPPGAGLGARLAALREEAAVGGALALGAVAMLVQEGPRNTQALAWAAMALLLAAPLLVRLLPAPAPAPAAEVRPSAPAAAA